MVKIEEFLNFLTYKPHAYAFSLVKIISIPLINLDKLFFSLVV